MYRNLLTSIRVTAGLVILMLGIIGLFLPILQGWLLIFVAVPLISPEHGKKIVAWLKEKKDRYFKKKTVPGSYRPMD